MPIAAVLDLLACPHCGLSFVLVPGGRSVRCASGHVFDLARQGYLNLLGRQPPEHADTTAMIAARDRFLSAGHYAPLADRIAALADAPGSARVLEVGAGTAYYLARVLDPRPGSRGLALDVSVPAARRAAGAHPAAGSVVADVWDRLPVPDHGLDVVLDVFAPRQAAEFHRVLASDGIVVTATPAADHLVELRGPLDLLGIQPDKHTQLEAALGALFNEQARESVRYPVELDATEVRDLVAMGPNAFHLTSAEIEARVAAVPTPVTVTVAVDVAVWVVRG